MYPRQFLDNFWSPEIRSQVFVAMSFDKKFDPIYNEVIAPACSIDCNLQPIRVDYEKGGDSIITKILDEIAHSKLIIAEISTLREDDPRSRNGNVMWEVGVAHAFRQCDEVILLRKDDNRLLFDIGPIRVHKYNDKDLKGARKELAQIIKDRLDSIEYQKSMLVDRVLRELDPGALSALLGQVPYFNTIQTFEVRPTMGNQQIWPKLFELGIVAFAFDAINKETIERLKKGDMTAFNKYRVTPFGKAVIGKVLSLTSALMSPSGDER